MGKDETTVAYIFHLNVLTTGKFWFSKLPS